MGLGRHCPGHLPFIFPRPHSHHTSKKDREDSGRNQISGSQALLRHWKFMVNFWDIAKDIRPSGKSGNLYSAIRGH